MDCVLLLLKLVGDLKGIPKGKIQGQGQQMESYSLRLPFIYEIPSIGGDSVCVGSLMEDKSMDMSGPDIPFLEFEG